MKKSLTHLPKEKRDDLKTIVQYVLELLGDQCEMIILYGSYARGNYVGYDQRTEYGVRTFFMSDYDLLVVTGKHENIHSPQFKRLLEKVEERFYQGRHYSTTTPIQFITEHIAELNRAITKGRYFYTDIKKEGIMLYDSGNYQLARRRKLNYKQIKKLAREYFDEKFTSASEFLEIARMVHKEKMYKKAAFMLHQACENLYLSLVLAYTLYSPKEHNLTKMAGYAKRHSLEVAKAFPRDTDEEERLFTLLEEAYVQARYNPQFLVAEEDVETLLPKVTFLQSIIKVAGEGHINEYDQLIEGE